MILTSMRYTVNDQYGNNANDAELMSLVGTPLYDQMLVFAQGDTCQATEMVEVYRNHNDAIHDKQIRTFPHVKETLSRLQEHGYRMGVITSKRHFLAERGLRLCDILPFFEFVIGSDDWPEHKPDPGPILHGCDLLGAKPDHCAYIGDSPFDIQAGNAAGCTTVAALWGMFSPEELRGEHPHHECDAFIHLPNLFLQPQQSLR